MPPFGSSSVVVLDQRHEVVLQKLGEDFQGSCLHSPKVQRWAEQVSRQRLLTMSKEGGRHENPFAQVPWRFPILPAALLASHPEQADALLQNLASQCLEAFAQEKTLKILGRPSPKIIVNCDCLLVGCIATVLSLAVNRNLNICPDYAYPHAAEQIRHLNKGSDADVLITLDGSFMLAGATDYRLVTPLHTEKQFCVVFQPNNARRGSPPRLILLDHGSMKEQFIITPIGYPVTVVPLDNLHAFGDQIANQLRPGDHIIMPQVTVPHAQQRSQYQLTTRQEYEHFVSMSIHLRWFRNGELAPCMRRFVELFIFEWNYLRADVLKWDGQRARELLFRDQPKVEYFAHKLLDEIQQWSLRAFSPTAGQLLRGLDASLTTPRALSFKQVAEINKWLRVFFRIGETCQMVGIGPFTAEVMAEMLHDRCAQELGQLGAADVEYW